VELGPGRSNAARIEPYLMEEVVAGKTGVHITIGFV